MSKLCLLLGFTSESEKKGALQEVKSCLTQGQGCFLLVHTTTILLCIVIEENEQSVQQIQKTLFNVRRLAATNYERWAPSDEADGTCKTPRFSSGIKYRENDQARPRKIVKITGFVRRFAHLVNVEDFSLYTVEDKKDYFFYGLIELLRKNCNERKVYEYFKAEFLSNEGFSKLSSLATKAFQS